MIAAVGFKVSSDTASDRLGHAGVEKECVRA
jgi:hypothetical protein